jgi:hypothetical protein
MAQGSIARHIIATWAPADRKRSFPGLSFRRVTGDADDASALTSECVRNTRSNELQTLSSPTVSAPWRAPAWCKSLKRAAE